MLIGYVGDTPKLKQIDDNSKLASIFLATKEEVFDEDTQEFNYTTEWHRIIVENEIAEYCEQNLKKGDKIYIEGVLRTRKWTDAKGVKRSVVEVRSDSVKVLVSA